MVFRGEKTTTVFSDSTCAFEKLLFSPRVSRTPIGPLRDPPATPFLCNSCSTPSPTQAPSTTSARVRERNRASFICVYLCASVVPFVTAAKRTQPRHPQQTRSASVPSVSPWFFFFPELQNEPTSLTAILHPLSSILSPPHPRPSPSSGSNHRRADYETNPPPLAPAPHSP